MRLAIALVSLAVVGCASAGPADVVRDSRSAIEIGKGLCEWKGAARPAEQWRARLRDGVWHVWLATEYGDAEEPICCTYQGSARLSVWVRASDGKSKDGCYTVID